MAKLIDSSAPLTPPQLEVQPASAPPRNGAEIPFPIIDGHVAVPMAIYERMIYQIRLGETNVNVLTALAMDCENREFAIDLDTLKKARKLGYGLNIAKNPSAPEMIIKAITHSEYEKIQKSEQKDDGKPVWPQAKVVEEAKP